MHAADLRSEKSTNVRKQQTRAPAAIRRGLQLVERLSPALAASVAEQLFFHPRRYARPPREREVLVLAQRTDVPLNGRTLAVWRWGSGERVVLLVHGWEGRGSQLGAFVEPLVEAGCTVVTFDAPAHGDSSGRDLDLVELAGAIEALVAREGGVAAIVAHSFGAAATTLALSRGARVDRVAYLAPAVVIEGAVDRFVEIVDASPELRAGLTARLERRTGYTPADLDGRRLSRALEQPLLVVHDVEDREVPFEEGRAIADVWPRARLRATRGLGHRKILWDRDVVAEVARFGAGEPKLTSRPVQDGFRALYLA